MAVAESLSPAHDRKLDLPEWSRSQSYGRLVLLGIAGLIAK
jgi:hypothetical protein